jgi:hypothetical protein
MPYTISQQRQRLDQRLDVIKQKLKASEKKDISTDLRDYAIAAAVFLAHAEFENYFIEALDGIAKAFSNSIVAATTLPSKLRAHLICERFGLENITIKIVSKTGEQDLFTSIEKWFTSPELALLTGAIPVRALTGEDIYGDYSYPSVKNVERVLRRLGVGDPRGALNKELRRDAIGLLESIGSLRTALAHSATLPGVTPRDISARIDGLKLFTRAFDRMLYGQAKATVSDEIWITAMS